MDTRSASWNSAAPTWAQDWENLKYVNHNIIYNYKKNILGLVLNFIMVCANENIQVLTIKTNEKYYSVTAINVRPSDKPKKSLPG